MAHIYSQLKKYSHNLKAESHFFWVGVFRTPSLGDRTSVAWENCPKEARRRVRIYASLQERERAAEHQRSGVKLRNSASDGREDARLRAPCVRSFLTHLSCLGPVLYAYPPGFLHPRLLSNHRGGGRTRWLTVWGTVIHMWGPEVADGCDSSCLLV